MFTFTGPSKFVFYSSAILFMLVVVVVLSEWSDPSAPLGFRGPDRIGSALVWSVGLGAFVAAPGVAAWLERRDVTPHWTASISSAWTAIAVFLIGLYASTSSWPTNVALLPLGTTIVLTGIGAMRLRVRALKKADKDAASASELRQVAPTATAPRWLSESWGPDLTKA